MKKLNGFAALLSAVLFLSSVSLVACNHNPNPGKSDPSAAVTETGITVTAVESEFTVGDEITEDDFVVKVETSDGKKTATKNFELSIPEANLDAEGKLIRSENSEGNSEEVVVTITYKTFTKTVTITVKDAAPADEDPEDPTDPITAPDLSSYFKKYFVTKSGAEGIAALGNWGDGSSSVKNENGSFSITSSAAMWGGIAGCVAPITNIESGIIAKYKYIVIELDVTDFTVDTSEQGGNYGFNLKIPETQIDIGQYAVTNGKVITFYVPVSAYGTAPESAKEMAIIVGGEGTLILNELYLATEKDPNSVPVTGITLSAAADSVNKDSTIAFTVKTSKLDDVTADTAFEIVEGEDTGATISGNVLTGGNAGTVKVKATYTCDDGTFTAEKEISVVSVANLITTLSVTKTHHQPGWADDNLNKDNSSVVEGTTMKAILTIAPDAQWQAQTWLDTDASVKAGDKWIFSCTIKGNTGNFFLKLNEKGPILGEKSGAYTVEGTTLALSGTAAEDIENINMLFDFGPSSAGTTIVEDIFFAIVE